MFLLDTMVVSERAKAKAAPEVMAWSREQDSGSLYISVLTLGEMRYGVERLPAGGKRRTLAAYLTDVEEAFAGRLLAFDDSAAASWAKLRRRAEVRRRSMPTADAMLAATAEVHGLTLVTRNTKDFEGWGGPVLNPWEPQPS